MHSALISSQSERIAGCKTDRRSFLMRGKLRKIIHVSESLMPGFLFEKARRKVPTDGRKRTKHRETLVREKTNDEEKWKLCFHFSISML